MTMQDNDTPSEGATLAAAALDQTGGDLAAAAGALLAAAMVLMGAATGSPERGILSLALVLKDDLETIRRGRRAGAH